MKDTFGPSSDASSPSAALQSSLENRLPLLLEGLGSPEYELTWKHWDMPSGPPICALRGSARRISDKGSTGWPTSTRNDEKNAPYQVSNGKRYDTLPGASLKTAGWPTVTTQDDNQDMEKRALRGKKWGFGPALSLGTAARMTGTWATPNAVDFKAGMSQGRQQKSLGQDAAQIAGWPKTPQASDGEGGVMEIRPGTTVKFTDGPIPGSSPAPTAPRAVLDAAFSRWLMGFPAAWDEASPGWKDWQDAQALIAEEGSRGTGTQSRPSLPPSSSEP